MIKATAELLARTEAHSVLLADAEAVAAAERVGLLLRLTTPLPGDEPTQLLIPKAVFSSIEQDGIRACATSPTQPDTAQLLRRRVQSLRDRKLLSLIGEKEQATAALLPALLMTAVCTSYICVEPKGGLNMGLQYAYPIAVGAALVALVWFIVWKRKAGRVTKA